MADNKANLDLLRSATKKTSPDFIKNLPQSEKEKVLNGEASVGQIVGLTGPEMLEMAMQGFRLYEQGRYKDAKVVFDGLCELDPAEAYYRTALGAIYLAEEDLQTALQLFTHALALNGKDSAALVNRGEVHLRLGNIVEAAQDFAKAVELDPENKDPLTMRARLLAAAALETIEAAQKGANTDTNKK
ncbi:tetratricopeptide repeat protein [Archangium lipolyticum]|uniref:tetratricopeptide repeat protein n=1 Tax=Archangium lipolyticum TaxID=2970465 RepID=UPI0027D46E56|nr:tetratricopeptide repeat protein [Archangium lipolyticum]